MFTIYKSAIFTGFLLFAISFFVFAAANQQIIFTFSNGESPLISVRLLVYFPAGIQPIGLTPNMLWDFNSRTLTVDINQVQPNEKISSTVVINGSAGTYVLQVQLIGRWAQVGQEFKSDLIPVETTIIESGVTRTIFKDIRSNPRVIAAVKQVVAPTAVALEVVGGGALVGNVVATNASIASNIAEVLRFVRFLGFGFFRFKRRKPWGKAYNQLTVKPIKGARIMVFEAQFQKLKDTQFTDNEGRFGFLVSPGTYYLVISKAGFQEVKTGLITVKTKEDALDINVPLISESTFGISTKPFFKFVSVLAKIINALNPFILALGTLASFAVVFILPTLFNFIVCGIYLIIDILRFILSRKIIKSVGKVIDKISKKPIGLAVVRIFDTDKNWLLSSRVTDADGHFKFLASPGNYYVTAVKEGYKSFTSQPLLVSKASALTWEIILEPAG